MRKVIKKEQVRIDDARAPFPSGSPGPPGAKENGEHVGVGHGGASVRVIRTEDRISAIEFTCACGERTTLEFEYGALDANQ